MNEYQKGYQAALADITAVMESAFDNSAYEGAALSMEAVEEWITNNTISDSRDFEYRGYYVIWDADSAYQRYEIYSSKEDADNRSDMITARTTVGNVKRMIDKWRYGQ